MYHFTELKTFIKNIFTLHKLKHTKKNLTNGFSFMPKQRVQFPLA